MITVVGLGPAGPEHLTLAALRAIDGADLVFLRTLRHPAVAAVIERRADAIGFDAVYDEEESFQRVYERIVDRLVAESTKHDVCYAVPGSPTVAERTVELLRERSVGTEVALHVEPAVSYLDLAWDRLSIDPLERGVRLADAGNFGVAATGGGPVMLAQTWSKQVLSDIKLALDEPSPSQRAVILHHLGLPDEQVVEVTWAELDRATEPDHLTSVFVPVVEIAPAAALSSLAATVATLRQRCPWDQEQTHRSLLRHLLEESYEAIEALEALGDDPQHARADVVAHAEEELGDLLCQVLFHATIGTEEGLFTLSDIARTLDEKLIARHPHVFGSAHADTADDVVRNWERAKDEAKQRSHLLEGIPAATPALARAEKVERKLRSVGLGWERSGETADQLVERFRSLVAPELVVEIAAAATSTTGSTKSSGGIAESDADESEGALVHAAPADAAEPGTAPAGDAEPAAGDLLLLLARWCADRRIDPEAALRHALDRLAARVRELEAEAATAGEPLPEWLATRASERPVHERHLPLC